MRNIFKKAADKISGTMMVRKAKAVICNKKGDGYVDMGVKILVAVVIGALLLAGLYLLFGTTIMPSVTQKITELFNYSA